MFKSHNLGMVEVYNGMFGQDRVLWVTKYTFGNSSSLTFVNLENLHELKFELINNDTVQESSSHDLKNLQTHSKISQENTLRLQ